MRHGKPPILKMQSLGMEPSLCVDVECTMTADFFTQMRVCMNMQRMIVNQMVLEQGDFYPPNQWPTPAPGTPPLLTTRDVLRYATMNGAKALRLDEQGRLAHAGQGGRHHHPRRDRDQRGAAQPGAGSGRVADGSHQRRDRDRRGQGAQVEGEAAQRQRRRSCGRTSKPRATTSSRRPAYRRTCSGRSDARPLHSDCGQLRLPAVASGVRQRTLTSRGEGSRGACAVASIIDSGGVLRDQ